MRTCITFLVLTLLLATVTDAPAAERLGTAVLPVTVVPKKLPKSFSPGRYVRMKMVIGIGKVERFRVLAEGDVEHQLQEHLIAEDDVKLENAAKIAKACKVRLLLFPTIQVCSVETETEDRVLIQTTTVVCTVTVGGTLYDAETGKSSTLGPYTAQERKVGGRDPRGRETITAQTTEKMLKAALEQVAKKVRSRIYRLYPLAGKILAGDGNTVTIDIGSAMGVTLKHQYVVITLVTRENEITGLTEKVPQQVSVLRVISVKEDSARCEVISGEKTPLVGSTVKRKLK